MGEGPSRFCTTQWSVVFGVQAGDEERRRMLTGKLLGRYWRPVYCYLRRKGRGDQEAKDLTQGFFLEVVLGRQLIDRADQTKGRFRSFIVTSLENYVAGVHRKASARKRCPAGGVAPLDEIDPMRASLQSDGRTPGESFDHEWALALLGEVLGEVEQHCRDGGRAVHWEMFRMRVLAPIMDNTTPRSLGELCAELGVASESTASNMIVTVKRTFQTILRRNVRRFVDSDEEVDLEIAELMRILGGSGARS
ncbi:MAG: sigma-70 family RNA polymerase sigma factor [Phycisphaerae bacterium]|nr:sigma-70 family RNA polymerase sigma factor [Phycisphaerae bacterium]